MNSIPPANPRPGTVNIGNLGGGIVRSIISAGDVVFNWASGAPDDTQESSHLTHRVREYWIQGLLTKSLPEQGVINLSVEERTDLLQSLPLPALASQHSEVTHCRDILAFLSEAPRKSMLLLGSPGCGKTTLLLQLVKESLDLADSDSANLPLVLNLSTWSPSKSDHAPKKSGRAPNAGSESLEQDTPLGKWIVDQTYRLYKIPERATWRWIKENRLLLFLDGLDELKPSLRKQCIEEITAFRRVSLSPIVVTCRDQDYKDIGEQFDFEYAFEIKPLSKQQIRDYLKNKKGLKALATSIQSDDSLADLAQSPLLLGMMIKLMVSSNVSVPHSDVSRLLTSDDLFRAYTELQIDKRWRHVKSKHLVITLTTLAKALKKQSRSIFYPEELNSAFLENARARLAYKMCAVCVFALLLAAVNAIAIWLGYWSWVRAHYVFGSFVTVGALAVLFSVIYRLFMAGNFTPHSALIFSPRRALRGLAVGTLLALGLVVLYVIALVIPIIVGAVLGGIIAIGVGSSWLWVLLIVVAVIVLLARFTDDWWTSVKGIAQFIFFSPFLYVGAALFASFVLWLAGTEFRGYEFSAEALGAILSPIAKVIYLPLGSIIDWSLLWSHTAVFAGSLGLSCTITSTAIGGIRRQTHEHSVRPDDFLFYSTLNATLCASLTAVTFAAIFLACHRLAHSPILWRDGYLIVLLVGSLIVFLLMGGLEALIHLLIRTILAASGQMELRLVTSLNEACDLALLRRVGGGYLFLHASELQYFAELSEQDIRKLHQSVL